MITKAALALVASIILLTGCSSTYKKEMTDGERLFRANCRSCHTLPRPKSHSDEQWIELVRRYAGRTNLSEKDQNEILKYLQMAN